MIEPLTSSHETSQIKQQDSDLQGAQRNDSRNGSHLPECLTTTYDAEAWCICDRLRACQKRERDLWERVAAERIRDLMSCHKPDDCHARADSIEVLLADVEYFREEK